MEKVIEIQVWGGVTFGTLKNACHEYIDIVDKYTVPAKLHFSITLDDGTTKSITFRQEDDGIHVYGDFAEMPDFLEWAKLHEAAEEALVLLDKQREEYNAAISPLPRPPVGEGPIAAKLRKALAKARPGE